MEGTGTSLLSRAAAILVLAVAAWILLKVVLGVITGVAFTLGAIILVLGVLWAFSVLRR